MYIGLTSAEIIKMITYIIMIIVIIMIIMIIVIIVIFVIIVIIMIIIRWDGRGKSISGLAAMSEGATSGNTFSHVNRV